MTRKRNDAVDPFRSPIHGIEPSLTPASATALLVWATVAFGTLTAAAAFLELDDVISATARIEPISQIHHVQHYEGGTIREVLVHEGDVVEDGAVLVRLVNPQGAQDLADRRARWTALMARSARLKADLAATPAIAWPKDVAIDAETKTRETAIHSERLAHRGEQQKVIDREMERRRKEVIETETKAAGLTRALAKAAQELKTKKSAYDVGVVGNSELYRLEREHLMLETETATARDAIVRLRAQLAETDAKRSEFDLGWRAGVLDEIGKIESELSALDATKAVAFDRESRSEVRSPVKGVVKMAAITNIGQVARPGDTLMDIVPVDDALVVEARVAPQDIGHVREGLPASVRLSAYDQFRFGHLEGTVTMVGADAIDNARTDSAYYRVVIRTDKAALADAAGRLHAIRPGMIGSASIVIGRKSVLRMLFDPLLRSDSLFPMRNPRFG